MRVFALSDIHVDYEVNVRWIRDLSLSDYQNDVLILAGDVTDNPGLFESCLTALATRFRKLLFVPGNHDLWVMRDGTGSTSLEKFAEVVHVVERCGGSLQAYNGEDVSIVPLFGWYDYSFGKPCEQLKRIWMDYRACRWPEGWREADIAAHFDAMNHGLPRVAGKTLVTFSHFMPRVDLMAATVPPSVRMLFPILGTTRLEARIRALAPDIHVYGHSHLNRNREIDGITYINNAFGYPGEARIARKELLCILGS